jgi:hypothetical protein
MLRKAEVLMQFTVPFVKRILLFFEPIKDKKSQSDLTAKDNPNGSSSTPF